MKKREVRCACMVYPGLFPLLMVNYWVRKGGVPIVALLISDYDIKYKGKYLNFFEFVLGMTKQSGWAYTFYMLLIAKWAVPLVKIWNFIRSLVGKPISLKGYDDIAKEIGIPVYRTKDFNSNETRSFLKKVNANLIVSAYNNQILKPETFKFPACGAINIHPALLPNFRGLDGPFEAMCQRVPYAGVTIHYIDSKIDTGEIVAQVPVRIRNNDTLFSLSARCWMRGAKLLEYVLKMIESDNVRTKQQDIRDIKFPYRSFPDSARVKSFLRSGRKLIAWRDIKSSLK